jgi:hypothetical protein
MATHHATELVGNMAIVNDNGLWIDLPDGDTKLLADECMEHYWYTVMPAKNKRQEAYSSLRSLPVTASPAERNYAKQYYLFVTSVYKGDLARLIALEDALIYSMRQDSTVPGHVLASFSSRWTIQYHWE